MLAQVSQLKHTQAQLQAALAHTAAAYNQLAAHLVAERARWQAVSEANLCLRAELAKALAGRDQDAIPTNDEANLVLASALSCSPAGMPRYAMPRQREVALQANSSASDE